MGGAKFKLSTCKSLFKDAISWAAATFRFGSDICYQDKISILSNWFWRGDFPACMCQARTWQARLQGWVVSKAVAAWYRDPTHGDDPH